MEALGPIEARACHQGVPAVCSEQFHQFPQNPVE